MDAMAAKAPDPGDSTEASISEVLQMVGYDLDIPLRGAIAIVKHVVKLAIMVLALCACALLYGLMLTWLCLFWLQMQLFFGTSKVLRSCMNEEGLLTSLQAQRRREIIPDGKTGKATTSPLTSSACGMSGDGRHGGSSDGGGMEVKKQDASKVASSTETKPKVDVSLPMGDTLHTDIPEDGIAKAIDDRIAEVQLSREAVVEESQDEVKKLASERSNNTSRWQSDNATSETHNDWQSAGNETHNAKPATEEISRRSLTPRRVQTEIESSISRASALSIRDDEVRDREEKNAQQKSLVQTAWSDNTRQDADPSVRDWSWKGVSVMDATNDKPRKSPFTAEQMAEAMSFAAEATRGTPASTRKGPKNQRSAGAADVRSRRSNVMATRKPTIPPSKAPPPPARTQVRLPDGSLPPHLRASAAPKAKREASSDLGGQQSQEYSNQTEQGSRNDQSSSEHAMTEDIVTFETIKLGFNGQGTPSEAASVPALQDKQAAPVPASEQGPLIDLDFTEAESLQEQDLDAQQATSSRVVRTPLSMSVDVLKSLNTTPSAKLVRARVRKPSFGFGEETLTFCCKKCDSLSTTPPVRVPELGLCVQCLVTYEIVQDDPNTIGRPPLGAQSQTVSVSIAGDNVEDFTGKSETSEVPNTVHRGDSVVQLGDYQNQKIDSITGKCLISPFSTAEELEAIPFVSRPGREGANARTDVQTMGGSEATDASRYADENAASSTAVLAARARLARSSSSFFPSNAPSLTPEDERFSRRGDGSRFFWKDLSPSQTLAVPSAQLTGSAFKSTTLRQDEVLVPPVFDPDSDYWKPLQPTAPAFKPSVLRKSHSQMLPEIVSTPLPPGLGNPQPELHRATFDAILSRPSQEPISKRDSSSAVEQAKLKMRQVASLKDFSRKFKIPSSLEVPKQDEEGATGKNDEGKHGTVTKEIGVPDHRLPVAQEVAVEEESASVDHDPISAGGIYPKASTKSTETKNEDTMAIARTLDSITPKKALKERKRAARDALKEAWCEREIARLKLVGTWSIDGAQALSDTTGVYHEKRDALMAEMPGGSLNEEDARTYPQMGVMDLSVPKVKPERVAEFRKRKTQEQKVDVSAPAPSDTPSDDKLELVEKLRQAMKLLRQARDVYKQAQPQTNMTYSTWRRKADSGFDRAAKYYTIKRTNLVEAYPDGMPAELEDEFPAM